MYRPRLVTGGLALLIATGLTAACASPAKPQHAVAVSLDSESPLCKGFAITLTKTDRDKTDNNWTLTTDGNAKLRGGVGDPVKQLTGTLSKDETSVVIDVVPNRVSADKSTTIRVSWTDVNPLGDTVTDTAPTLTPRNPDACPKAHKKHRK